MQQVTAPPAASAANATGPASGASAGSGVEPQRRERKKLQTRTALVHAALTLFNAKGYEHTTVREITDAVDVSERTFFRYFASKEDLTLSFIRDSQEAFLAELIARPASEPPFAALANAFRSSMNKLTAADEQLDEPLYLLVVKVIDTTPSLVAGLLRDMHGRDDEIIRVLAEREGVDPETDRRPRIAALAHGAVVFAANREWRTKGDSSLDAMLAAFDAYADELRPALDGHWT
jgi:AcrR family transcriptional regulator